MASLPMSTQMLIEGMRQSQQAAQLQAQQYQNAYNQSLQSAQAQQALQGASALMGGYYGGCAGAGAPWANAILGVASLYPLGGIYGSQQGSAGNQSIGYSAGGSLGEVVKPGGIILCSDTGSVGTGKSEVRGKERPAKLTLKTSPLFGYLRWRFDSPFAPLTKAFMKWFTRLAWRVVRS